MFGHPERIPPTLQVTSIAIRRLASSNLAPGRDRPTLAQYTLTREELL
jgi:hypothetical protein